MQHRDDGVVIEPALLAQLSQLVHGEGDGGCDVAAQQCPQERLVPLHLLRRWCQRVVQPGVPAGAVGAEVSVQRGEGAGEDALAVQRAVRCQLDQGRPPGGRARAVLIEVREADLSAALHLEQAPDDPVDELGIGAQRLHAAAGGVAHPADGGEDVGVVDRQFQQPEPLQPAHVVERRHPGVPVREPVQLRPHDPGQPCRRLGDGGLGALPGCRRGQRLLHGPPGGGVALPGPLVRRAPRLLAELGEQSADHRPVACRRCRGTSHAGHPFSRARAPRAVRARPTMCRWRLASNRSTATPPRPRSAGRMDVPTCCCRPAGG